MSELVARIVFTGICMFVHPEDGKKPPEAALFMKTPGHQVFLALRSDLYRLEQTGSITITTMPGEAGVDYSVVQLDGKIIEIGSAVKEGTVEVEDLQYVPSMGKVWPRMFFGTHKGAKELHEPLITALKDRVNARFDLAGGRLKNTYVSAYHWQFRPKVATRHQLETPIAQEVTLRSTIAGNILELRIRDRENGSLQSILKIERRVPNIDVVVLLANVPRSDLFPKAVCNEATACETHPECCADPHFVHYYNAFDDRPGDPPVPFRLPIVSSDTQMRELQLYRVGGANCGPTQYP